MFVYQSTISSFQRLIQNDESDNFKIIVTLNSIDNRDESVIIEKQNHVIISTTINKARIISKTINDKFIKDPTIKQHEFDLQDIQNNQIIKIEDVVEVFKILLESTQKEVIIPVDKKDAFLSILGILGEKNLNLQQENNELSIFECDFEGDELSGIISCIRQMSSG